MVCPCRGGTSIELREAIVGDGAVTPPGGHKEHQASNKCVAMRQMNITSITMRRTIGDMGRDDEDHRFHSGDELRQAAENAFGRSLETDEWQRVDPAGWSANPHGDFTKTDLDDLLQMMALLPPQRPRSPHDRQRARARAHQQRVAAEASTFVAHLRQPVFGAPNPPFPNDGLAAAAWIEANVAPPTTSLFRLQMEMPAHLDHLARLEWLREWLLSALPKAPITTEAERDAEWVRLVKADGSPLRELGFAAPTLAYLAPTTSGGLAIKRVRADPGTVLGNLRDAADRLAPAARWTQVAAVHHLLTGGVMSSPVPASVQHRFGKESFGGPVIIIEIPDPFGVSANEVAQAFVDARKEIWPRRAPRQRSRSSARQERLSTLLDETPNATWVQRWVRWNKRYPDDLFRSADALRKAYHRNLRP
jgi:hypothetical protein